jgi:hypothetical protein
MGKTEDLAGYDTMNQEFLRPRLIGRRFDEHTLPLDILKDFSALEEMLIEVAKRQYFAAHPDRKRTPKGFTKGLELHLTAVEEGSAIPVIALAYAMLFPSADAHYFDQAKDKIVEAIAAAEQGLQPPLPPELLRYFDRFGRGLQEGEAMEFVRLNGQITALTPATRLHLLHASQAESWTEEVTLKGRIPEVDQADHGFELELRDGAKLKAPLLEAHRDTVLEIAVGYRAGAMVAIKGVIERDRADRPRRFESVEHVSPLDPLDIETRLEELAQLQKGWLDGKGCALDQTSLIRLAQAFEECFSSDLPLPHLYPTPEGGVQAEWTIGQWEVSLEITLPDLAADYQAVHLVTGEAREQEIMLANMKGDDWKRLNDALTQLQEDQV